MIVADVAARDARGDEEGRTSGRRIASKHDGGCWNDSRSRTSNAETEFSEWAELCRDDDQNDLRERRLDEAKLCGDVYGELKFLNAPVDPVDINETHEGPPRSKKTIVGSIGSGGTRRSACAASRRCGR